MESVFFHPRTVHVPIALSLLMPAIAAGILLSWSRGWLPARAWIIAVLLQAVLAGSAFVAAQSGENEEDRVEEAIGGRHVNAHEAAAEQFLWASGATLALMLIPALFGRRRWAPLVGAVAVAATMVVLFLGYRTGQAGGALVYRHGAAGVYTEPPAPPAAEGPR